MWLPWCLGMASCDGLTLEVVIPGPPAGYTCNPEAVTETLRISGLECSGQESCRSAEMAQCVRSLRGTGQIFCMFFGRLLVLLSTGTLPLIHYHYFWREALILTFCARMKWENLISRYFLMSVLTVNLHHFTPSKSKRVLWWHFERGNQWIIKTINFPFKLSLSMHSLYTFPLRIREDFVWTLNQNLFFL